MRTLAGSVLLLLASCVGPEPGTAAAELRTTRGAPNSVAFEGWTVTAVRPTHVTDDLIAGAVTFERMDGAATRGGGACLIADLYDNTPCESADDCFANLPVPDGGFHYCLGPNGTTERKRCWTRPTAGGCTRSPSRVPGTYPTEPVSPVVDGRELLWITIACMADESNPAGCASPDPSQHVYATSAPLGPDGDD
jgi:hypothetical protein